jgi:hypothetical protein
MDQRIYHGNITPTDVALSLFAHFNRGNYHVQQIGTGAKIIIQIASTIFASSGGQTALTVTLQAIEDGVTIQMGQQNWLGVAASLGTTAFQVLHNPMALIGRLDDLAQDIESLQLSEDVWKVIEDTATTLGTTHQLSEKLRRLECEYCGTANPVGEPRCIACGAPLGQSQPVTCPKCGFVVSRAEKKCPNCGAALYATSL